MHYVSDYRGYRGRREHSVNLALKIAIDLNISMQCYLSISCIWRNIYIFFNFKDVFCLSWLNVFSKATNILMLCSICLMFLIAVKGQSRFKTSHSTELQGTAYKTFINTLSLPMCGMHCQNDMTCSGFNYELSTGTCKLLSAVSTQTTRTGWIAGQILWTAKREERRVKS